MEKWKIVWNFPEIFHSFLKVLEKMQHFSRSLLVLYLVVKCGYALVTLQWYNVFKKRGAGCCSLAVDPYGPVTLAIFPTIIIAWVILWNISCPVIVIVDQCQEWMHLLSTVWIYFKRLEKLPLMSLKASIRILSCSSFEHSSGDWFLWLRRLAVASQNRYSF